MKKKNSDILNEVFEKHKLRKTPVRADILAIFFNKPFALSHGDLEETLKGKYDRVTIYRTLHLFEKKGLIHKVPDENGLSKYALCSHDCSSIQHHDEHIHFLCSSCGHTFCLNTIQVPDIALPQGYTPTVFSFTIHGICPKCK